MLKRQVKTLTSIPNSEKHPSVGGQILLSTAKRKEGGALEDIRRRKWQKQILAGAKGLGKEWLHARAENSQRERVGS